ncbi:MAG TPA: hypothetical protein PLM48_06200 [Clostridia bacterium]|nr:hypothetical protein [Clostridia bacterium]
MKDSILQIAANMVEKVWEILDNSDLAAFRGGTHWHGAPTGLGR